ncbi:MAG: 50S ribosomal protein L23 [Alphaproteobacteria bacterium TMED199]|jgi:large subunit ribosomal protein L23|nr:MAG: 50S ribosomal protein L23 [Alphaproteobacteria bacterium TMED199]|tara:strand:+ start:10795 stop:11124 length:330 start_codon:yes stop_codon:yes gene_type:complete
MSVRPRKKIDLKISQNKAYQIILNPLVTEKSTQQSEFNKMVFSVPVDANKLEVKSSIEKIFSVKVVSVNTILLKGKVKRFKGVLGRRSNTKKAIVTLAPGNTIDLSAGV